MKQEPETDSLIIERMRSHFEVLHPLTQTSWDAFRRDLAVKRIEIGDKYICIGAKSDQIGFIYSGLMRSYYVTRDGVEFIHTFMAEGEPCTAYSAALQNSVSKVEFDALEKTILIELPLDFFRSLFLKFEEWNHIGRILLEKQYIQQVRRINDLLVCSAEERFDNFLHSRSDIVPRLKQIYLASYLGIAPESLSRLRARRKNRIHLDTK
jgi:CRP/FNR family transcriptional regulator, anaerobic regulatory protein